MLKNTTLSVVAFALLFTAQFAGAAVSYHTVVPDNPMPPSPPEQPNRPICEILDIMQCEPINYSDFA